MYGGVCPNFFTHPTTQMFLSKVHGSARNILFLQLHKLYKKGLACPLQSSTIRLHITDVLHNSRRSIYTDESMIRFLWNMIKNSYIRLSLLPNVQKTYVALQKPYSQRQLVKTPLTQYQVIITQKLIVYIFQHTLFK